MDHIRISGNELSSVILGRKSSLKVENSGPKVQKEAEANKDGVHVINSKTYNLNEFNYGKFWCYQNAMNKPKSTVELGYMCPRRLTGPPAVTLTK